MRGPDQEAPRSHVSDDIGFALRSDRQIVLEDDRLPVQHEAAKAGIAVQAVEQFVRQPDEANTELLERLVPFTVPVRMRDESERALSHRAGLP
jgi:hypothetical protein